MVDKLLARLEGWLITHRPDYYALLRPGASDAELDDFESRFALTLPAGFRQLYRWRNGQDPLSFASLQGNRSFMTLADIASAKAECDAMIGYDFEDPHWWRRGWVPFLHNGGGSYLCVDTAAEDGGQPGQLVAFWKADADRPIEYESVEAWLTDLVRSMEDGTLEL
jgi:cell wall assembly regulator SMI1